LSNFFIEKFKIAFLLNMKTLKIFFTSVEKRVRTTDTINGLHRRMLTRPRPRPRLDGIRPRTRPK